MRQNYVKNSAENMKFNSINLDITFKCPNKCPACYRQRDSSLYGKDIDEIDFEKIVKYFEIIRFCGQISDPVMHPKFHLLLEMCVQYKRIVQIHTAVSLRPNYWWEKSFNISTNSDVEWVFGIDGLPKDSHKYRINQDGEKLFQMMLLCSKMGIKTTWQYIVFNYNEDNIYECEQIARDNNITFKIGKSARFKNNQKYHLGGYRPSKIWRSSTGNDIWINESGQEKTSTSIIL